MRKHPRRARVDSTYPEAWATSDRNGMISNLVDMQFQYDWAGTGLVKQNILVSQDELDEPQRQLGTVILPPDPPPIMNARPENYFIDEDSPQPYTTEDGFGTYVTDISGEIASVYETEE